MHLLLLSQSIKSVSIRRKYRSIKSIFSRVVSKSTKFGPILDRFLGNCRPKLDLNTTFLWFLLDFSYIQSTRRILNPFWIFVLVVLHRGECVLNIRLFWSIFGPIKCYAQIWYVTIFFWKWPFVLKQPYNIANFKKRHEKSFFCFRDI